MTNQKRKSVIEATENDFTKADDLRRLVTIYKANHDLPTLLDAAYEMIKATAEREALGLKG